MHLVGYLYNWQMGFNSVFNNAYLLLTHSLSPYSRGLLEKLTGLQLVKKFPAFLWNPKVHYRTHKRPPPVPILCQLDPVHTPTTYFLVIHLNIILPNSLLTSGFPTKTPSTHYMLRPSHFLYFITRTIYGEQYRSLSNTDH